MIYFILLCCLAWFYTCKFHICLPIYVDAENDLWSKRGKWYANNRLCLWSDVYQDYGFWLVCLNQLDLLIVKCPVKLCDWGFIYCQLPRGSWTQGFRKHEWAAGNQWYRTHGYMYSKCWVSSVRVSLLTTKS